MNTLSLHKPKHPRGALLPVALVLTILGGVFISSFMAMSAMRSLNASQYQNAARRRLALENSKAYAMQAARLSAFTGNATLGANQTTSFTGNGGGSVVMDWAGLDTDAAWTSLNVFTLPELPVSNSNVIQHPQNNSTNVVIPHNYTGLRPGYVFSTTKSFKRPVSQNTTSNYEGMDNFKSYLFMKSAVPCLNGDAWIYYQKPPTAVTEIEGGSIASKSNYRINGRLVVRDPASFFPAASVNRGGSVRLQHTSTNGIYIQAHDPQNRITSTDIINTSAPSLPLNYSSCPSTFGAQPLANSITPPSGAEIYNRQLNIIGEVAAPPALVTTPFPYSNTLWAIQEREDSVAATIPGAPRLVTLGSTPSLSPTGTTTSGYQLIREPNPVTRQNEWVVKIRTGKVDLPDLRIFNGAGANAIKRIIFEGQANPADYLAASLLPPRIILIYSLAPLPASVPINSIEFTHENSRRIILGVKGVAAFANTSGALQMKWDTTTSINVGSNPEDSLDPPTPLTIDWRLVLVNEFRTIITYPPAGANTLKITGGVMTNWTIKYNPPANYSADKITVAADWKAPYSFARLMPRDAWLETYMAL